MYILADGQQVMDTMHTWDVLNVTGRSGDRLELSAYDGTPVYVEFSQVSLRNDREKKAEEEARITLTSEEARRQREIEAAAAARPVIGTAMRYLGRSYAYGGESLDTGIDCSSYVQKVYAMCGIALPRISQKQYTACVPDGMEAILPASVRNDAEGRVVRE